MSSRRHHARSPAVPPLDDDDLLCEILLRLPPQPSSLPRASAVCKRWRSLASDAGFSRRFRLHHRRNLPLLGIFDGSIGLPFLPTLEAPNRVAPERFSLSSGIGDFPRCLGCRHGLVLIHLQMLLQILVWDPVTGDQHRIALPAPFNVVGFTINGAVFRAAGDVQYFQVVLAAANSDDKQQRQAIACVYSSQTGLWGNLISTPLPYRANGWLSTFVNTNDAVLAGDFLYWVLAGNSDRILEFDLVKQSLDVIRLPMDMDGASYRVNIMRAEGGGLGVFFMSYSHFTAQLWKRKTDCDGVTSWGLGKIIELDKLLSLKSEEEVPLVVLGYGEDNNVVFLETYIGLFMIHLKSLKFKKLLETIDGNFHHYHPFESVYTAEICAGGGHGGAELLRNTQDDCPVGYAI